MPTIPNHVNHSHKFMIQLGAMGNKSSQVMSHGKTSPSDLQVNSWTALDVRSDVRLDIHSDTRAYPPLSNHLLSPILPTPLTATPLSPHPSDSASDVCRMSVLQVPCRSELLITNGKLYPPPF